MPAPKKMARTPKKAPVKPRAMKSAAPAKKATRKPVHDWREQAIARMRLLIREADPDMVEEPKWRKPSNGMKGVPVWSHDGIVCTGETYKDKVKFTFARGAALEASTGLFNADDRGSTRRAIDIREGTVVDAAAFKTLVQAAVEENGLATQK